MLDHALAVLFAIGFPLVTTPAYKRRRAAMLRGDSRVRRREYLETIVWLTAMGVASVALWLYTGRDFTDLGLGIAGPWRTAIAVLVAAVLSGLLFAQARTVRRDPEARATAREALAPVREYFPTTAGERRMFRGVSLAAGLGEEIYYRGFLLWYLSAHVSVVAAVALSSVLFGFAHVMHGAQATIRSTGMGVVLAGLYLASGSLWASIVLHIAVDLSSGETGFAAFSQEGSAAV